MSELDAVRLNFTPGSLAALNVILALVMFGVALDMKGADFRRVREVPRAVAIGLLAQFALLPAVAWALTMAFRPQASIALGLILVACCPGGNVSNFLTHYARGNAALSVTMTGFSTLGALVMTPFNLAFWGALNPDTRALLREVAMDPVDMLLTVGTLLVVPAVLGMAVASRWPRFATRAHAPFRVLSLGAFAAFVVIALAANWEYFLAYTHRVLVAVFLLNALGLALGYAAAAAARLHEPDRRAVAIETGIQNSGLGLILVFNFFGGLGGMAVTAAWWGIWHLLAGVTLASTWRRHPPRVPVLRLRLPDAPAKVPVLRLRLPDDAPADRRADTATVTATPAPLSGVTATATPAPMRVLVTGAAGYLGRLVVTALARERAVVVATDVREVPPSEQVDGVEYLRHDVRMAGLDGVLAARAIDTVVHLAAIVTPGPTSNERLEYEVDVLGTRQVLDACVAAGVRQLIVTSSGAAYGYHADNRDWLTEDDPVRGHDAFAYSRHKRLVEEMLADYRERHPALRQVVFRVGTILGATTRNQITALFDKPRLLAIRGSRSPFVFVWDEDVVGAILHAIRSGAAGIYNVAGDGALDLDEIARRLGKRCLHLPAGLLRTVLAVLHPLRLSRYGPEQVDFLRYRPVLDNRRLKERLGYVPRMSSSQVFDHYRRTHGLDGGGSP